MLQPIKSMSTKTKNEMKIEIMASFYVEWSVLHGLEIFKDAIATK